MHQNFITKKRNTDTIVAWLGIIKLGKFLWWILRRFILGYIYERPMILFISKMNKQGSGLIGVEIGVYLGDNAFFILNNLPIKKLFLVDPYLEYKAFKGNTGWTKVNQYDFNKNFVQAKEKVKQFEGKTEFIRKKVRRCYEWYPQ